MPQIVIDIPEGSEYTAEQILRDALHEFVAARAPHAGRDPEEAPDVSKYVDDRYAHMEPRWRALKADDVRLRVRLARDMLKFRSS